MEKNYERKKERKELRTYYKTFLNKIIVTTESFSHLYKNFYQSINIDSGIPTTPPKILTGNFDRVNRIEDAKLFYAIKEKENLAVLLSNIDYVQKLISEIDNYHTHYLKQSEFLRTPLQEMINNYIDLLSKYTEHVRITNPNYPNCSEFNKLVGDSIMKYYKEISGTRQLKEFYRKILRPVQEYVVETDIFRRDVIASQIAELGKEISHQYNHLKRLVTEFRLDYRKFYKYTVTSKDNLIRERDKITWH